MWASGLPDPCDHIQVSGTSERSATLRAITGGAIRKIKLSREMESYFPADTRPQIQAALSLAQCSLLVTGAIVSSIREPEAAAFRAFISRASTNISRRRR